MEPEMRAKTGTDRARRGPGMVLGEGEGADAGSRGEDPREKRARPMLELLRWRLVEAHRAGENVLKLEPEDLRDLCAEAESGGEPVAALRTLVVSNLVRLRGRWRDGVSGVTAPVYVARVVRRAL